MKTEPSAEKDLYYTNDHEWINFQGAVAYLGICRFKLTGFKQIHKISFNEFSGFKRQGEVIATVRYNDYLVEVHMPVDGKLVQVNENLVSGNPGILLDAAETAWIALIVPSLPLERKNLLRPNQYQLNGKINLQKNSF